MDSTQITTFGQLMSTVFTGTNLALLGAFLAVALPGWGSAKGVGMVGQASSGLLSEDPTQFGKVLILEAIPGTQGIYGLITSFMILLKINAIGGAGLMQLTLPQGEYLFISALPIALVGFTSAIHQAKVAASGVSLIAKQKSEIGKAITNAALVETYAIFSLLVSLLLVNSFKI